MPRAAPAYAAAVPLALPADVRLMNAVASAVFVLAGLGALVGGVLWLMKSPLFPIRGITLEGQMARNSVPTIRANAAPRLAGNFFSVDLQAGRAAFEAVPWVRRAVVRRVWPDRLAVRLEEHQAVALWQTLPEEAAGDKLVNSFGEVFQANIGDVEEDQLPTLSGPEGSSAAMLALYRRVQPTFEALQMTIGAIELSGRGSWRVVLDSGATIELGRGSEEALAARCERFARTFPEVAGRWQRRPLEYADLRHTDGYAIRLRGVSTAEPGRAVKTTN